MLTFEEATQQLYRLAPRSGSELVALADACGRICAETVAAPFSMPMEASSAMDGYAFTHADVAQMQAAVVLPVSQIVHAGEQPRPLACQTCARVFTGSLLPPGADTVVIQENVSSRQEGICFSRPLPSCGSHVRQNASIYAQGDRLVHQGQVLQPQHLSLIASTGASQVQVVARPRVGLLSTGDELLQIDDSVRLVGEQHPSREQNQILQPWQCIDSNQPQMATLLQGLGCEIIGRVHVPDSLQLLQDSLLDMAGRCDLLITCGGSSVGEKDYFHRAITSLGKVHSWKVAVRPGKPFLFGSIRLKQGSAPVLCLPGNPLSAFMTGLMLVRPFIGGMLGISATAVAVQPFYLASGFSFSGDARRVMWLQVIQQGDTLQLAGRQLSDQLVSAAQASGVAVLEPGQRLGKGELLPYLPYNSLLYW